MKHITFTLIALSLAGTALLPTKAQARNDRLMFKIETALKEGREKGVIGDDIKLFFSVEASPKGGRVVGPMHTHRKTNSLNKTDIEACNWAFLSAVKSLQQSAREKGANAVTDIKSTYNGTPTNSATEFVCGAGSLMSGVALEGKAVELP